MLVDKNRRIAHHQCKGRLIDRLWNWEGQMSIPKRWAPTVTAREVIMGVGRLLQEKSTRQLQTCTRIITGTGLRNCLPLQQFPDLSYALHSFCRITLRKLLNEFSNSDDMWRKKKLVSCCTAFLCYALILTCLVLSSKNCISSWRIKLIPLYLEKLWIHLSTCITTSTVESRPSTQNGLFPGNKSNWDCRVWNTSVTSPWVIILSDRLISSYEPR